MFYKSTRNDKIKVNASEAIVQGLSSEGGLFPSERLASLCFSQKYVFRFGKTMQVYKTLKKRQK